LQVVKFIFGRMLAWRLLSGCVGSTANGSLMSSTADGLRSVRVNSLWVSQRCCPSQRGAIEQQRPA
jgi:hypothetical protein